jgi:hypothetical protein
MNEQIKECWIKAAREDSGDKWDTQEEFIERFARLIVRECAEVAYVAEPYHAYDLILKRFGLKGEK